MGKFIDLTGKKFNKLLVISRHGKDSFGNISWLCKCDCGNEKIITGAYLKNGDTKSCGCISNIKDISGQRFGRILVLDRLMSTSGNSLYKCLCDCGKEFNTYKSGLISGRTKSCGCLNQELRKSRIGIKNGFYNKDLTNEDRERGRNFEDYYNWRKIVLSINGYKCKKCGCNSSKDNRLHTHHILNYSSHPELRTDVNNGIVLCKKCHYNFHKIYGQRNNTQDQISIFLQLKGMYP